MNSKGLVPIGRTLKETKLFLKVSENDKELVEISDSLLVKSYETTYEGILFHHSSTRICLINNEKVKYVNSGDLVTISCGEIYVIGRSNRSVKINGKLTDMLKLEMVIRTNNT